MRDNRVKSAQVQSLTYLRVRALVWSGCWDFSKSRKHWNCERLGVRTTRVARRANISARCLKFLPPDDISAMGFAVESTRTLFDVAWHARSDFLSFFIPPSPLRTLSSPTLVHWERNAGRRRVHLTTLEFSEENPPIRDLGCDESVEGWACSHDVWLVKIRNRQRKECPSADSESRRSRRRNWKCCCGCLREYLCLLTDRLL
jgi:hypothetical protein